MPRYIALVERESELIDVPAEVLLADVVESAVDAALQHRPNRFDAIGRNAVADVRACLVVDRFLLVVEIP